MENKVGINGLDKAGNTALYWGCHGGHKGKYDRAFRVCAQALRAAIGRYVRSEVHKIGTILVPIFF